jgi:hypothetical protein
MPLVWLMSGIRKGMPQLSVWRQRQVAEMGLRLVRSWRLAQLRQLVEGMGLLPDLRQRSVASLVWPMSGIRKVMPQLPARQRQLGAAIAG